MKKLNFVKMAGSGNDFIVIKDNPAGNLSALAKSLCDRKIGIGADGLLILEKSKKADFRMRIFNADGSEAEMCGNGARCAALYGDREQGTENRGQRKLNIETKDGIIKSEIKGHNVKIKLTEPKNIKLDIPIKVNGRSIKVNFINTGVPHTVIFVDRVANINLADIGRSIRYHKKFAPGGTNVNFVEVRGPNLIRIRTYERGVEGETLSCGTGGVASALIFGLKNNLDGLVKVQTESGEILKVYFGIGKYKILSYAAGGLLRGLQATPLKGDSERSERQRDEVPMDKKIPSKKVIPSVSEEFSCQRDNFKFNNVWLEGSAKIVYKGEYYV